MKERREEWREGGSEGGSEGGRGGRRREGGSIGDRAELQVKEGREEWREDRGREVREYWG